MHGDIIVNTTILQSTEMMGSIQVLLNLQNCSSLAKITVVMCITHMNNVDGSSSTCPIMQAMHVASFDNILTTKDTNLLVPSLQCRSCHLHVICWEHS